MILIKNLKLISKKDRELDRLTRFVKSEYNNGGQKILTNLFDAIIAYYPHYQFDRKEIYKKITGESGFEEMDKKKENLFNSYISQLNGIVEQFLMTEQLKTDHFLQQQLLAKAYLEKNDFSKFLKTNSVSKKRLPANQSDSDRKLATIGLDLVFHPEYDNLKDEALLVETLLHTERASIFEQLKIYAELFSISILVKNPIHLKKVTEFLKKSTKKEFLDFIPIKVYTQVLDFRIKNEAEKYLKIVDLFESNFSIFSKSEQMQLFSLIQGFNIRNINNNQNCINQTYDFFNLGIKLNCFEMGKPISDTTFLNIANSKSMLYKFDEYDDFVSKYSKSIGKENKELVENLAKSNYYFYKFEETKDHSLLSEIQKISSSLQHINGKLSLNLILRMNLCKTYFELSLIDINMSQLVDNEIIAFKSFIKRKKINEEKVVTYSKFFNVLSELNKLVQKPSKKAKVKLLKRINKLMPFGNSTYLLQKIDNL